MGTAAANLGRKLIGQDSVRLKGQDERWIFNGIQSVDVDPVVRANVHETIIVRAATSES